MEQVFVIGKQELEEVIQGTFEHTVLDGFCNRFRGVMLSPEEVAKIHGVHKSTVIGYIHDGAIEAERNKEYGAYHIRLSDALRLDFKELRRNLKLKQQ
jgi:hypothetical protein